MKAIEYIKLKENINRDMNEIAKNLLIILGVLLIIVVFIFILVKLVGKAIDKILIWAERLGNFIYEKFASKFKSKYRIIYLESFFILVTIVFITGLIINKNFAIISFVYLFLCFILGYVMGKYRKCGEAFVSIFDWIEHKSKGNYILNLLPRVFEEFPSILFLLTSLMVAYSLLIALKWPDFCYFIFFLLFPFFTNSWIYFTYKVKFRIESSVNIRRMMMYVVMIGFAMWDSYSKFLDYFNMEKPDFINFWANISIVLFIGLERLLKAIYDDYSKNFKKLSK